MPGLTSNQTRAVQAEGDVLVLAGAGTGKTRTLVERCLRQVLDETNPVSLDELLMVTFTEAAAGEMRKRIRSRLGAELARDPGDVRLPEQLALVDTAQISTLHSFCLRLVRDHFHELGIDPEVVVLDEAQAEILAGEALDAALSRRYGGGEPGDEEVRQFVLDYGGAQDQPIRDLIRRIHRYCQTRPDPDGWLASQQARFQRADPDEWQGWLERGLEEWRLEWLDSLGALASENGKAAECLEVLEAWPGTLSNAKERLARLQKLDAKENWVRGTKTRWRPPLKALFSDVGFLATQLPDGQPRSAPGTPGDPLAEDWVWVRAPMLVLLGLVEDFTARFARAKRELGAVDFPDLEQLALRVLWDPVSGSPTPAAVAWQRRLRLVFVDEYQDINGAQDLILRALRPDHRFFVGDGKQSIYRFRLADPHIFQGYARRWRGVPGAHVVPLSDNFRSHEAILEFVNRVFAAVLHDRMGGIGYDEEASLRPGDPANRGHRLRGTPGDAPATPGEAAAARVELHLRLTNPQEASDAEEGTGREPGEGHEPRSGVEEEAAIVAARLAQLRAERLPVWDDSLEASRPVDWHDMVVLLRAPTGKAEAFAKVFHQMGVPLVTARGGLLEAIEVSDLLSLLEVLDNPLQDLPLLAVLRSPLVNLHLDELALVRLTLGRGEFWTALQRFHAATASPAPAARGTAGPADGPVPEADDTARMAGIHRGARAKVDTFLRQYHRWRDAVRRGPLSNSLEAILDETHYEDWLRSQPAGEQRSANVRKLLGMTRQFDRFQRQGLFRFLRFIEARRAAAFDPEPAVVGARNAVRLMSIHQSKGLEFPVVAVADLGKSFNLGDLRGRVVLDEVYGLCPLVKPPGLDTAYPSLPYWLAVRRQRRELLGEEMRLLYVATTRASDRLILVGSVGSQRIRDRWQPPVGKRLPMRHLLEARTALDWLGPLVGSLTDRADWQSDDAGRSRCLDWYIHSRVPPPALPPVSGVSAAGNRAPTGSDLTAIAARLNWTYPFHPATQEIAKSSVTALRRRVVEDGETDAQLLFQPRGRSGSPDGPSGSAVERGLAHHRFLQFVALNQLGSVPEVQAEADRLASAGVLTPAERKQLDLAALAGYGTSTLGQRVRDRAAQVERELEFTARFSPADLATCGLRLAPQLADDEFVVVQGVVDLAIILEQEIWVVDFKTDRLTEADLPGTVQKYAPQLQLYALALERIQRRPVTELWLYFLSLNRAVPVALPRPVGHPAV